jgi:hypothetical protein
MRERLFIFLALIILVVVLIGLNAASYVQKEKMPDTELTPNRSTYNTGATGTRAFYDLLSETGRKVTRWQEPPSALLQPGKNIPQTFVVIGSVRRAFEEDEIKHLLEWVSLGGKLVIIDREPPTGLIVTTVNWQVTPDQSEDLMVFGVDPSDQKQMTDQTVAGKPTQPTVYTVNINAVQPSRLASSVYFTRLEEDYSGSPIKAVPMKGIGSGNVKNVSTPPPAKTATPPALKNESSNESYNGPPTGTPFSEIRVETTKPASEDKILEVSTQSAPVVHLANDKKNLLIDFPYGSGKIVYLTDPYIVSNSGLGLVDNARLGINVVASSEGAIVFDEYHQGYGSNKSQLLAYFAGTPVVAIVLQLAVLIGVIFYSQSRRFARALPEDEPNRLSKLEYVAAMAELQQRTKGYDLAIENIYSDFRRRTARSFGVDNHTTTRRELANLIAERAGLDPNEVENLLFKCEDIIHGEPTNKKEVLELTSRLREMEEKLGLQRRKKRQK